MESTTIKTLAIMLPIAGIDSEIWAKRQAESFTNIAPLLLSWETVPDPAWILDGKHISLDIPWNEKKSLSKSVFEKLGYDISSCRKSTYRDLNNIFCKTPPNAALCHFGWTASMAYASFDKFSIPFFIIFHGLDLSIPRLKGSYLKHLKKAVNSSAGCIFVGSHMEEIIKKISPDVSTDKLHRIPCGAPLDKFSQNPIPIRTKNEPLKLIAVCRLVEGKGIDLSLKALKILNDQNINVTLTIIGDGIKSEELKDLTKALRLERIVHFQGSQNQASIAKALSEHHVLLQPSRKSTNGWVEGFGVSITEAMASGLPIIASKTGGIPDQVRNENDGFLIESEDYNGLANAINKYANDEPLRQRHATSAREQSKQFDATTLSKKLEDLIIKEAN